MTLSVWGQKGTVLQLVVTQSATMPSVVPHLHFTHIKNFSMKTKGPTSVHGIQKKCLGRRHTPFAGMAEQCLPIPVYQVKFMAVSGLAGRKQNGPFGGACEIDTIEIPSIIHGRIEWQRQGSGSYRGRIKMITLEHLCKKKKGSCLLPQVCGSRGSFMGTPYSLMDQNPKVHIKSTQLSRNTA